MLAALVPYREESLNLQIASYENTLQSPVSGFQHSISSGINHKNVGDSGSGQIFYIDTLFQIWKSSSYWFSGHKCYPNSRLLSTCVIITKSNIFPENIFLNFSGQLRNIDCSWHKENGNFWTSIIFRQKGILKERSIFIGKG